ncbi:hypothetical protein GCM10011581_48430 [Saccharopolyspora subtropica]|uniref:Uncharacterized protein n=1 Tax=Saccharopolyspora thermophila TaxID=89367 RepID=A0A917NJN8_9PSEU|nr:hypothetical protein [Saccharopolyspora subtropica]GGJ05665.1 hypothetical protein GCM10011581_48430 [Saccharopolyspora subtropica]
MNSSTLSDNLHEVLGEVRRLRRRFARTAPAEWDPVTAAAELSVQVGHLALCVLRRQGRDVGDLEDTQRPITDVGDELADVALAALSIAVLADADPDSSSRKPPPAGDEVEAFLRLLVAAGTLSETAMVVCRYRHRPNGLLLPLSEAASRVITACEALANHLGLDLLAEFRSMAVDADAFLKSRGDGE